MSQPIVAVSLKMYFERARTVEYCRSLASLVRERRGLGDVRMAVLPDFLALHEAGQELDGSPVMLGAQDICQADRGAYTGEVSGADLADLGVRVVEVGHAERRALYHEDDRLVADKAAAARRHGMIPLVCVGPSHRAEPRGMARTCADQVRSAVGDAGSEEVWVAYEPRWAIGASEPAHPEDISEVCHAMREELRDLPGLSVLYGGSAGPGLLSRLDACVDGLFLGRFAHEPAAFLDVVQEAAERTAR